MAVPLTTYKTQGVYVQEIRKLPPSIAQVDTAIPVFIGYTEQAIRGGEDITNGARARRNKGKKRRGGAPCHTVAITKTTLLRTGVGAGDEGRHNRAAGRYAEACRFGLEGGQG